MDCKFCKKMEMITDVLINTNRNDTGDFIDTTREPIEPSQWCREISNFTRKLEQCPVPSKMELI